LGLVSGARSRLEMMCCWTSMYVFENATCTERVGVISAPAMRSPSPASRAETMSRHVSLGMTFSLTFR